jgi:hypothetical protein
MVHRLVESVILQETVYPPRMLKHPTLPLAGGCLWVTSLRLARTTPSQRIWEGRPEGGRGGLESDGASIC